MVSREILGRRIRAHETPPSASHEYLMGQRIVLKAMRVFVRSLVEFGYLTRQEADGIAALIERLIKTTPRPESS